MDANTFTPHSPEQEKAITFTTPTCVLACGIQFGKTKCGSVWMKIQNHTFIDPSDNFLIIAPTYKILTQSTLPPYLQIMRDFGSFSKSDMVLKIHGGGTVYMRSGTDPDSIVGITNIRAIWGDECGLFSRYFYENIVARAAFRNAQVLYTTSPYAMNWLYKDIIRPKLKDPSARPDVTLVQAASWQNPFFPKEVIERNRMTMDPRRFNALFGGKWERMTGLVYDCYDEIENTCEAFPLPTGTRIVAGVDWGYTHPFVIVVRAVTPSEQHFQIGEFYQTELTIDKKVEAAERLKRVFGIEAFYCDPARPDDIAAFNKAKLTAIEANNDIRTGIDRHYELMRTRRFKIFKGTSPHTEDELETYHYPNPEDKGPDKADKEVLPVDKANHCCLAADTEIETKQGIKLISEVKSGDLVRTPLGFRRVERAWMTSQSANLIEVSFSNGTKLKMTPDHPIYQFGKGFSQAQLFGKVSTCSLNTSCLKTKSIVGMDFIGARLVAAKMAVNACTKQFGRLTMGRYLKDFTYITKTTISTIITSLTLSVYREANILSTMVYQFQKSVVTNCAIGAKRSGILQQRGIEALRGERGIETMRQNQRLSVFTSVMFALKSFWAVECPNFARTIVSLLIVAKQAWTILKSNVSFVLSHSQKTNMPRCEHVHINAVEHLGKKQEVYNLTIPTSGCFYANGILVSNCDAMRYVTMATYKSGTLRKPVITESKKDEVEDIVKRIEMHKRRPRASSYENWS